MFLDVIAFILRLGKPSPNGYYRINKIQNNITHSLSNDSYILENLSSSDHKIMNINMITGNSKL
jgi:hypothetical protein